MNEWIKKQNIILNWWIDIKLIKLKVIIYFIYLILFKNDMHINNQ